MIAIGVPRYHHFRHHLIGTRFRVRTDHRPLQFRSVVKDPWGRRARWTAELEEYTFSMEYIEGHQNRVADLDALSRLGFQQDKCEGGVDFEEVARFWWPTIQKDVVNYTQSCTICGQRMPVNKRARAPLLGRPKAAKPFEIIEMDIKNPLPRTDRGFQYGIFWWYKTLSHGMPRCVGMPRQTAEEVCEKLREWIGRYGIPVISIQIMGLVS